LSGLAKAAEKTYHRLTSALTTGLLPTEPLPAYGQQVYHMLNYRSGMELFRVLPIAGLSR
jgi:hypothetical protein